jgi:hypothetical protein
MSSPAGVLTLQRWEIQFHETMAALLRAQEAVRRQFGFFGILNGLWRSSRDLKAISVRLKEISELPDGTVGEEFIQSQIPQLRKLLRALEELMDSAKHHRLMNRSLTAAPLGLINVRGEYIADYLDALEMALDPAVLAAIQEGQRQIESGECEVVERLF